MKERTLQDRLNDFCRCGHKLSEHDFGAIHTAQQCNHPKCKCMNYHKESQTDGWFRVVTKGRH